MPKQLENCINLEKKRSYPSDDSAKGFFITALSGEFGIYPMGSSSPIDTFATRLSAQPLSNGSPLAFIDGFEMGIRALARLLGRV
jgi:hypothetical protein